MKEVTSPAGTCFRLYVRREADVYSRPDGGNLHRDAQFRPQPDLRSQVRRHHTSRVVIAHVRGPDLHNNCTFLTFDY